MTQQRANNIWGKDNIDLKNTADKVVQYNILLSPAAIVNAFKEGKLRDGWKGSVSFNSHSVLHD